MDRNYGGVIWTNHALSRLKQRGIKQGDAWAAFNRPDSSKFSKNKNAFVYRRSWEDIALEVVAVKNDEGKWVVLSVWSEKSKHSINTPLYNKLLKWLQQILRINK